MGRGELSGDSGKGFCANCVFDHGMDTMKCRIFYRIERKDHKEKVNRGRGEDAEFLQEETEGTERGGALTGY